MLIHPFTNKEALRIAVEIEKKGERFYRMAQKIVSPDAGRLMEVMGNQEKLHAGKFQQMLDALINMEEVALPFDDETSAYLSMIASEVVFPGGVLASMMNHKLETAKDAILMAIGSEKDSILFYMQLMLETKNEEYKSVFSSIITEEKRHLRELNELIETM